MKPINELAKEIAEIVNKGLKADRNKDGKIQGGEVTALIFGILSSTPSVVTAINATVATYKGNKTDVPAIIADVVEACIIVLENLNVKNKKWIQPTAATLRVAIVATVAGMAWSAYADSTK